MKRLKALITLLFFSTQVFAGDREFHVVQEGETLSQIARRKFGKPVYPKISGSLARILELNPQISDRHRIYPGQRLNLLEVGRREPAEEALPTPAPVAESVPAQISVPMPTPAVVPPAVLAPAPAPAAPEVYGEFTLAPRLFFTAVRGVQTSNGTAANLVSALNTGLDFAWIQHWSPNVRTHLGAGTSRVQFSDSPTRVLNGTMQSYSDFEFGAEFSLTPGFRTGLNLGAGEEIFYHAVNASEVSIDRVPIGRAELTVAQDFFSAGPFRLGAGAAFAQLTPASTDGFEVRAGSRTSFDLRLEQNFPRWPGAVEGKFFFRETKQNTDLLDLSRRDMGVSLTFKLRSLP